MHAKHLLLAFTIIISSAIGHAQTLEEGFENPPEAARPRVWWHWMNGNITKDGIRKDILWMNRSGIAGFQQFDASFSNYASDGFVPHRLSYLKDDWKKAIQYAIRLADSLNMEVAVASSPGFSSTGGPWVKPEDAMKKLVWRTITVNGGQKLHTVLPHPFKTIGKFQNVPVGGFSPDTSYYSDIVVVAMRLQDEDKSLRELGATVSSSGGNFTLEQLTNDDLNDGISPSADEDDEYAWIQYEFADTVTFKAMSLAGGDIRSHWRLTDASYDNKLLCSDDGVNFREVCKIPSGSVSQQTIDITSTTARYFRLMLKRQKKGNFNKIAGFNLYTVSKINHAEEKAGFAAPYDLHEYDTPSSAGASDVVILNMSPDGKVDWEVPGGRWKIFRFGCSLTGKKNHPVPKDAEGLEVDKYDPDAWSRYFHEYLDLYKDAAGGMLGQKGIQYILVDSYEAEFSTWTPAMREEFKSRMGYDLERWLPVLAGEIIGSAEESEKFLFDWRTVLGNLFSENYCRINEYVSEYGLKGCYTESHENGRAFVGDGMDPKRTATVPMAAFWFPQYDHGPTNKMSESDLRESASVAHIYGQNIVAAESFTTAGTHEKGYIYCPDNMKPMADFALSCGLNRFIIHDSAHQPVDDKVPGLGLGIYGQWFNRHETWAEYANVWMDYLSRSCYLLQQGRYVADILWYYGEDNNICSVYGENHPPIPEGYSFDYINKHGLLNDIRVDNGKLASPSGMRYSVLCIGDDTKFVSDAVRRKIQALKDSGVVVIGPNLKDSDIRNALVSAGVGADASFGGTDCRFVHRKLDDGEIFWISNPSDSALIVKASLRVSGFKPQLWHPDTGLIEDAEYSFKHGRTEVSISMIPHDAVFVVFTRKSEKPSWVAPEKTFVKVLDITGPWKVSFETKAPDCTPAPIVMDKLASLTESSIPDVKYFSGMATYSNNFKLDRKDIRGDSLVLDLGEMKNLAEVIVNGRSIGVAWRHPFTIDISNAIHPGDNTLEIKVVNLWPNRIIGDKVTGRTHAHTPANFYNAKSRLLQAGLLGPVCIKKTICKK